MSGLCYFSVFLLLNTSTPVNMLVITLTGKHVWEAIHVTAVLIGKGTQSLRVLKLKLKNSVTASQSNSYVKLRQIGLHQKSVKHKGEYLQRHLDCA